MTGPTGGGDACQNVGWVALGGGVLLGGSLAVGLPRWIAGVRDRRRVRDMYLRTQPRAPVGGYGQGGQCAALATTNGSGSRTPGGRDAYFRSQRARSDGLVCPEPLGVSGSACIWCHHRSLTLPAHFVGAVRAHSPAVLPRMGSFRL